MNRRPLVAVVTLAVALSVTVWAARGDHGSALGPVIAITPLETNPGLDTGYRPSLSGRGEAVGVNDRRTNFDFPDRVGFVFLDHPAKEIPETGRGISVSGDGCAAIWLVPSAATFPQIVVRDRCNKANNRTISLDVINAFLKQSGAPTPVNGFLFESAMSQTGQFAAIEMFAGAFGTGGPAMNVVMRLDTRSQSLVLMPTANLPGNDTDASFGMDISDNGAFVAVAVRAPIIIGFRAALGTDNREIFVAGWDVGGAANVVSSSDGSVVGSAAYPSVSGDGRYVAFAAERALTGAEVGRGPFVFVRDRTRSDFRLVSPASASAYYTSISGDATQVAYGRAATTCPIGDQIEFLCPPTQIDVAYGSAPGMTGGFQVETVSVDVNNRIIGEHHEPSLSANGRYIAWRSNAGPFLTGNGQINQQFHAFVRRRDSGLTVSNVNFGSVIAPGSSSGNSTVTNTGRSTVSIAAITPSPGAFVVTGGTCAAGVSLPPGATCSVNLRFDANGPPTIINGLLTVSEAGFDPVSGQGQLTGLVTAAATTTRPTVTTTLPPGQTTTTAVGGGGPIPTITQASTTTLPGATVISATPDPLDFGDASVLIATGIQTLTVQNTGTASGDVVAQLGGANPGDFELVGGSCTVGTLLGTSTCTLDYRMTALASGARTADLVLTANGSATTVRLTGIGRFEPRLATSPAAVTERGIATIIGQGFPPGELVTVHVDETVLVLTAIPNAEGMFRLPLSPLGRLELGSHDLRVDDVPTLYVGPTATLIVVLPTFSPQGPTGPAFNNSLLVARG